jgi:hypothetical protein
MTSRAALSLLCAMIAATAQSGGTRNNSHQPGVFPDVLSSVFRQLPSVIHISEICVHPTFSGSDEIALLTASEQQGWEVLKHQTPSCAGGLYVAFQCLL